MAITKQKKAEVLSKVRDIFSTASTVVFVNFHKLTVAEERDLRAALRTESVGYTVAKKTLIKKALEEKGVVGEMPTLEGEIALAYGTDEIAPARAIAAFVKKYPEHVSMLGGIFAGAYVDQAGITSIAAIPGMEALRAQFVQLINSPLQRFAVVLNAKADKANAS